MDDSEPPNPFATSPSASPVPSRPPSPSAQPKPDPPSKPSSTISAASGSPPPTHRASFPDPAKEPKRGSSRLSGPIAKVDFCCTRDKEIHRGEEIGIVDAFKTSEGGKASYITYVIKLGVRASAEHCTPLVRTGIVADARWAGLGAHDKEAVFVISVAPSGVDRIVSGPDYPPDTE